MLKKIANQTLISTLCLLSTSVFAHWQIDNDLSRVNFVSVKNNTLGEAHYFKQVNGELNDEGKLQLEIDLSSVETDIPIRNERMQQFLFVTNKFPKLKLNADLKKSLATVGKGQTKIINTQAELNLHGMKKLISSQVLVTHKVTGDLVVSSMMPIIINPKDFALTAGIEKLQQLAKLPSITHSVPVSFVLTLEKH